MTHPERTARARHPQPACLGLPRGGPGRDGARAARELLELRFPGHDFTPEAPADPQPLPPPRLQPPPRVAVLVRHRRADPQGPHAGPVLPRPGARHARRLLGRSRCRGDAPGPHRGGRDAGLGVRGRRHGRALRRRHVGRRRRWTPARIDGPVVVLQTRRMDRVLEVDARSRAAHIQGGASGPVLEAQLARHGLTLRFFPQSFALSTLGGWIATRAAGHFATGPTHIDDLVEAVSAVTPTGRWSSRRLPASGAGPSPDRLLLGSEGTLGVVTDAWVRVRPRPRFRAGTTVHFQGADDGFGCGLRGGPGAGAVGPAACRLPAAGPAGGAAELRRRRHRQRAAARAGVRRRRGARRRAASRRPLPRPRRHRRAADRGRRPAGDRHDRRLAAGVPAHALRARRDARLRPAGRHLRVGVHVGRPPRRAGARPHDRDDRAAGDLRRRGGDVPPHARLPRRRRALLDRRRAGAARQRARAVGGGQGRRRRGRSWPPAGPSPTTTRSGATTAPGTTASVPMPFAAALRAAKAAVDPRGLLNPGVLLDP